MSVTTAIYTNGVAVFQLAWDAAQEPLARKLIAFLTPYFQPSASAEPHMRITLHDFAAVPADWRAQAVTPVTIRESGSPLFQLSGQRFAPDEQTLIVIDDRKRTAYHIAYPTAEITLFASDESFIHLVELVRYVSLLIEEAHGTLVLHATATVYEDQCYLIAGNKGAGKSTTLLHLILDYGHTYFSGDKVLISQTPSGLRVRGWPDYPHLGMGTLRRFPAIAEACGLELTQADGTLKPDRHKELIEPETFHAALPRFHSGEVSSIAAMIYPQVAQEQATAALVDSAAKHAADLLPFVEHPHEYGLVQWHQLLQPLRRAAPGDYAALLEQLCAIPWVRVTGRGAIDPQYLLHDRLSTDA